MSEENSEEKNKKIRDSRMRAFEGILNQQFQLAYFGHISYEASEHMSITEREYMYSILVKQKETERKQQEEALKEAKANKRSKSSSKPRKR